jgi:hypothetical protein
MPNPLIETITSDDPAVRNRALISLVEGMSAAQIAAACEELEAFRRRSANLYERVRACMFLFACCRFRLQESPDVPRVGLVPFRGWEELLNRRYEEAIATFRATLEKDGPGGPIYSALAECYHHLAFQTLADQVRRSVRSSRGNQWMFRVGHVDDHPVRVRRDLHARPPGVRLYPILCERTPVRMDLSHSGWSDIFFLGMDYPEGARVVNLSIDLGVHGRDTECRPPIETRVRLINEPVLRLTSVDLHATKDVADLRDLFNFGNDYLGLLKAGVIASGLIPPSFEGTDHRLDALLGRIIGPGMGLEIVTKVNDIPKGSRLAVSTSLLASLIALLMRAAGQTRNLEGPLQENERRLVASRAILGEWLGGSGGGWQDSGGIWPGAKVITGVVAGEDDPEYGISRGRLLPAHHLLGQGDLADAVRELLAQSAVLVHGGMAQDVGPILEMVTEKYLLRAGPEWQARADMRTIFDGIIESLRAGNVQQIGALTTANWDGPLKTIIPWVTNRFTEAIIARARERFGKDYWGFLMLGGMSGGGMAFFVDPKVRHRFVDEILDIMLTTKHELEDALPFAMDPLVYDFQMNDRGSVATLSAGADALMPARYYALHVPEMLHLGTGQIPYLRRADLDQFTTHCTEPQELLRVLRTMVNKLFPAPPEEQPDVAGQWTKERETIRAANGFDPVQHEKLREDLRRGRIGLARNRLPVDADVQDVRDDDVILTENGVPDEAVRLGEQALREGRVAVVTLAAGLGSRWTTGAGVVKAVNPFLPMAGRHRSFIEIHLARNRATMRRYGAAVPCVITTSYLTHGAVEKHLRLNKNYGYEGPLHLSPGRSIGQRLVPMVRDLQFLWEEMPQETLDERKQKVRDAVRGALIEWARAKGEGADYVENAPFQCLNPPGHWYEVPNMFRNGVLAALLKAHPNLEYLLVHNIDTLGAELDPGLLGLHIQSGAHLTFEVIPKRVDDRGGGLARVDGRVRLLEGLAQPRESTEFRLRYYNSLTSWVNIDRLLEAFGLTREDLNGPEAKVAEAVREMAARVPTYVTIKDVKRRWGHAQEDIFPVTQFEKLWGDMTALPQLECRYLAVSRLRGQQLKSPAQLDPWVNDGSKAYIESICTF